MNNFAPKRRGRASQRAARDLMTIATQAPQVVSMRLARMATHGMAPSASDRREMVNMGAEKLDAFSQGWMAMGMQMGMEMAKMQQQLWAQMLGLMLQPMTRPMRWPAMPTLQSGQHQATRMGEAWAQVAAAGLAPVRQRVAGNAKRLAGKGRSKLR
jgi:hypothetical protein